MQKIVINRRHGGFGLSHLAVLHWAALSGTALTAEVSPHVIDGWDYRTESGTVFWPAGDIPRDCPHLVATVTALGSAANTRYSDLAVVEIPDEVSWTIEEYDGAEWVAEAHRTWR